MSSCKRVIFSGDLPLEKKQPMEPRTAPITYDRLGRMQYHPDFHANQKLPWTTVDERYLVDNYEKLGPEEVSFALERTITTVMTRAYILRKKGIMPKPMRRTIHRRSGFGLRVA